MGIVSSPSLWDTARYRLKYCLKGPLGPKRATNHFEEIMKLVLLAKRTRNRVVAQEK